MAYQLKKKGYTTFDVNRILYLAKKRVRKEEKKYQFIGAVCGIKHVSADFLKRFSLSFDRCKSPDIHFVDGNFYVCGNLYNAFFETRDILLSIEMNDKRSFDFLDEFRWVWDDYFGDEDDECTDETIMDAFEDCFSNYFQ